MRGGAPVAQRSAARKEFGGIAVADTLPMDRTPLPRVSLYPMLAGLRSHVPGSASTQCSRGCDLLFGDAPQEVVEALSVLVGKALADAHLGHAVEAEVAEVFAHLAPGRNRPTLAPEIQPQGPHAALARGPVAVAVFEAQAPSRDDGLAEHVQDLAELRVHVERRGVQARALHGDAL